MNPRSPNEPPGGKSPAVPEQKPPVSKGAVVAVMGGAAYAAALLSGLAMWEGKKNVGYLDIAGIPTACYGDTKNVEVGKFYSDAECNQRLERQAMAHMADVKRCTPNLTGYPLVAAGLLTYNIGASNYCSSSAARYYNAGRIAAGCKASLAWDRVTVKAKNTRQIGFSDCRPSKRPGYSSCKVRGLTNRRQYEYKICMTGL